MCCGSGEYVLCTYTTQLHTYVRTYVYCECDVENSIRRQAGRLKGTIVHLHITLSSYFHLMAVLCLTSLDPPDPPPSGSTSSVPFSKIMNGVTFALSGFKNPSRGQLRDKALAMGAKYEPDWGPGCSHLM